MKKYNYIEVPIKRIVKKKITQNRAIYDLEIENNNSYIASGIVVHNSTAQPFLRPAMDSNIENIKKIFADNINKIRKWL